MKRASVPIAAHLLASLALAVLSAASVLQGCSANGDSVQPGTNAGAGGSNAVAQGGGGAGHVSGGDSAATACGAVAPSCYGFDSQACCAFDPGPHATCQNGKWMCGSSPSPGCLVSESSPGFAVMDFCGHGVGGQASGMAGQAGESVGGQAGDASGGQSGDASGGQSGAPG